MKTEFKDSAGRVIGAVESDNSELLLGIEQAIIGTRIRTEGLDVWVAGATVTDDDGVHVMDYDTVPEPAEGEAGS